MANVAIIGATGYGGVELIRLLQNHPEVRLAFLSSESYAGKRISDVYPHLAGVEAVLHKLDPAAVGECDFALLALPAGKSMEVVPKLLQSGTRVVDVGPDFRLRDPGLYPRWYQLDHSQPQLLKEAVLSVPELHRERIKAARLAAAPGCYTTAALLALAPLVADGLIDPADIIADGKTGISGAGRTALKLPYHHPEANEDATAYAVGGHRHMPEMVQELQALTDAEVRVTFTPHLVPMTRGILLTAYLKPLPNVTPDDLRASCERRYANEAFVRVLPDGQWPHTKWTAGTNSCFLGVGWDEASGRAIVVAALDNLGKGMAGQMVQCLNLMLGVDETTALRVPAAYP
ncbi:MAG: N-acetyl-gamma-glutamyl-phosphate reductase [Armatimonadota bacterium]|nr:MAG: N-acetyl-gamma-glutamyl-phosphate reductase [Armatimonadota bacterium]